MTRQTDRQIELIDEEGKEATQKDKYTVIGRKKYGQTADRQIDRDSGRNLWTVEYVQ